MKHQVFDLHVDVGSALLNEESFLGKGFFDGGPYVQLDLSKAVKGGYHWLVSAVFPGTRFIEPRKGSSRVSFGCSRCIAFEELKAIHSVSYAFPNVVHIIRSKEDLSRNSKGIGFIIGLEGSYPLAEPQDLIPLFQAGVRLLGLTWNVENGFAASCMSKKDYGLTASGEELVKLANKLGVVIDLAHASFKTMVDVLIMSNKPVVVSHTASLALNEHPRNTADEILDLLKKNGGVVGVALVPSFLTGKDKANIADVVKHILHFTEVGGVDHVAIGTDFLGTDKVPKGLENASKIQSLFSALVDAGLSKEDVEKIAWKNAYRVFSDTLP